MLLHEKSSEQQLTELWEQLQEDFKFQSHNVPSTSRRGFNHKDLMKFDPFTLLKTEK